jgi:hypothetical protein
MQLTACDSDFDDAKRAIEKDLKDPSSVQYRNMKKDNYGVQVCGEFNSKNSMGGYVGFKPFIYYSINKDKNMLHEGSGKVSIGLTDIEENFIRKICDF